MSFGRAECQPALRSLAEMMIRLSLRGKERITFLAAFFELRCYTIKRRRLSNHQLKALWPYPVGMYIFDG